MSSPQIPLRGDKILQIINASRLYDKSIRDYMVEEDIHDFTIRSVEDIAARYRDFKIMSSVYDYTDMLVMAKTADISTPPLKYMFIDEAQDLSTLQWILIDRMAATAENIIIAGDDKQAINEFAGADVEAFLTVPGKVEVLEQSYRVPKKVFNQANIITHHMTKFRKEGSNWKPRTEEGTVKRCSSLPINNMYSGDWLVLARTAWQLEPVKETLMRDGEGLLFTINGEAPVDMDAFRAISLFKASGLPQSQKLSELVKLKDEDSTEIRKQKLDYIRLFKKFISFPRDNSTQPWEVNENFLNKLDTCTWQEAFDKIPLFLKRYYRILYPLYLKKGDKLYEDANIRLMTIHAAKGREAENVLVILDVPRTVKNTIINRDTDTEAKILYVAVTRAKKNLYLYGKDIERISLGRYLK